MKNLCISENGASIVDYSSQYHHESRVSNLLLRESNLVWFSDIEALPPHYVTFKLDEVHKISRVGIFLHGESNQNPAHIEFQLSEDNENWTSIVNEPIEHRQGDFFYDLPNISSQYVKLIVHSNFGGSGIFISKVYAFASLE
ncbi:hypothetical protein PCE1_004265 [Barthelona sp. PCE]